MFRSSVRRLRDAILDLTEDFLGDAFDEQDHELDADAKAGSHTTALALHPHRRPVRLEMRRRAGSVQARPAHCLSPIREHPSARRTHAGAAAHE